MLDRRTRFGHPLAHQYARPSVLDDPMEDDPMEDDLGPAIGIWSAVLIAVVLWAGSIFVVSLYVMW